MLDNNGNVTGLRKANEPKLIFKWRLQVSSWTPALLLVQPLECCPRCSALETCTPPHHQLSVEGQACAAKTGPASPDNLDEEPLFHPAEPLTHPARTVDYARCRKQLLTILSLMFCLFCISGALLWTMFWFLFLFFSPRASAAQHLKALQALMI